MDASKSFAKHRSAVRWIVAGITFAVFLPAVFNDFVDWDDLRMIVQNSRFNPPTWSGVAWYWTHVAWNLYMPLTCTLWAALARIGWVGAADQFGGHMNPQVFHLASVLLHTVATVTLFEILCLAVRDVVAAGAGAILFAVHPIQVETVAFAGAMNNSLFAALSLVAIWQYLRWTGAAAGKGRAGFWLGTAALVLAMLAKPTAVVVPPIAFVLDRVVNRREWKAALRSVIPWAALCVPCVLWTKLLQQGALAGQVPIWARPMIAGDAVGSCLTKILWPVRLGIDYGRTPEFVRSHGWMVYFLAVTVAVIWASRKSAPLAVAGLVIFLIALLPNSGLAPFDFQRFSTVADRYAYLAMIGPAVVVAEMATKRRRLSRISIGAIFILLILQTEMQIRTWRDGVALFSNAVAVNPNSWMSWSNLGNVLADSRPTEAIADCRRAAEINPLDGNNWNTLGSILMSQGDSPGAVEAFARACALTPDNALYAGNYRRATGSSRN